MTIARKPKVGDTLIGPHGDVVSVYKLNTITISVGHVCRWPKGQDDPLWVIGRDCVGRGKYYRYRARQAFRLRIGKVTQK